MAFSASARARTLHRFVPLLESPGYIWVRDVYCSWDQPCDETPAGSRRRSDYLCPALDPVAEDRGGVLRVIEGPYCHEPGQGLSHVEAVCLGVPEGSQQQAVGGALAHLFEAPRFKSRTSQQVVPALLLRGAGQSLVLGGEDTEVLDVALCSLEDLVGGKVNATALVRLGIDVKTAQQRLGHSDVGMTIGLYAQAEKPADRAAADRLGELFMADPRDGARDESDRRGPVSRSASF